MSKVFGGIVLVLVLGTQACMEKEDKLTVSVFETSANGNQLTEIMDFSSTGEETITIEVFPNQQFQTITGFGGSFTEASAHLLNTLGKENRTKVLEAYFGDDGARYSLTRTHMNSCDFSLGNYSYAPVEGDMDLEHFSIAEDKEDIIPMVKDAMGISKEGFKIVASPWTAPPWMKDNKDWRGGKLLPKYQETWALFFSKYVEAYKNEGIPIWGFTVENEPLGNDSNWESMHFSAEEMTQFVQHYLGPKLEADGHQVKILGYDQNREHLKDWVNVMFANDESAKYYDGTAIHWYASTFEVFPEALQYAHEKAPTKHLIQTEACVDAEIPQWKNDLWYWQKEATDWGWDWAPEADKHLHPKYAPVNRYARDIIGCLNNWVDGWIDWNMVLDRQGGPNWFKNWCVAPVIVDTEQDEVYFTPIYYVMSHFSRYIRPGAKRIGLNLDADKIIATAAKNPDGGIVLVVFNEHRENQELKVVLNGKNAIIPLSGQALQTVVIKNGVIIKSNRTN